jgi:hypothetical protein
VLSRAPTFSRSLRAAVLGSAVVAASACGSTPERPPPAGSAVVDGGTDAGTGADGAIPGPVSTGVLVSATSPSTWQAETQVAWAANGDVFVVWISLELGGRRSIGFAVSHDAGTTFGAPAAVPSTVGDDAVDPSVTVDGTGTFHVTWLELPAGGNRRVMGAEYMPGGISFTIPVEISDTKTAGAWDKPAVVAQDDGSLLVVYGTENGASLTVARSADRGLTWTRSTLAPDGTLRNIASACTSGTRAYVVSLIPDGVELVRSADSGVTWSAPLRVDIAGSGAAFEAPSCAAGGTDVWIVYGTGGGSGSDTETPVLDDVRVARSTDSGASIASRVSITEAAPAQRFLLPSIARDPGSGGLVAAYYAAPRRGTVTAVLEGSFRVAFSDDGATWGNHAIVRSPITMTGRRDGFDWLGDYVGIALRDGAATLSFTDNTSVPGASQSRIRVARAPR